jgi:predicted GNAT superfamily acetyltransferase
MYLIDWQNKIMPLQIRMVENIDQMIELSDFFNFIWADGPDVVSFDLGYALIHVGGYASLAYQDDVLVGASFGAPGIYQDKLILHSHVTAVTQPGVGFELKKHQFSWAQQKQFHAITWTFDPMVRRNSVFNLEKLGATAIEFLPNFYGTMTDIINAGDQSDRLFAYLPIDAKFGKPVATKIENIALLNQAGTPVSRQFDPTEPYAIYLPEDIEALRKSDLNLVKIWREHVRELLANAFAAGCEIKQMVDDRKALLVTPTKGTP